MAVRQALEYVAYRGALGLLRRLPFSVLSPLLLGLGSLVYRLGVRRRVVEANLSVALGESAPRGRIRDLARRCYAEHGRIVAEIVRSERFIGNPDGMFRVSGIECLRDATAAGRGVIILTAHLGNYLLGGYLVARRGYPLVFTAKPVRNEALWREIEKVYTRHGNGVIPVRGFKNDPQGGLAIFRSLRRGKTVVVLSDQDAGPEGYRSTFFGRTTFIPSGPAHFALRSGAVVLTAFTTRRDDRIAVDIQAPIDYSTAKTREEAERVILDEYSRRLEAKVRETPELYFWFHKKWKAAPEVRARYEGRAP